MAYIGDELKTYLKTKSAVTSLVGAGSSARIYENAPKQGVKPPFVVYRFFEGFSAEDLSGISGIGQRRCQIDCYHNDGKNADALLEAIRLAPLQGYRGLMNTTYVHGVTSPATARTGVDDPPKGSKAYRYWASRDFLIAYTEATS